MEHIVRKLCLFGVRSILITEEKLEYSSTNARCEGAGGE